MPTGRRRFFDSLAVRVAVIIVLTEVVILSVTGISYIRSFDREIDQRMQKALLLPAALVNQGVLQLDVVTDQEQIRQVVGDDLTQAFVIGINGNIFFSLDADLTGRQAGETAAIDPGLLAQGASAVVTQDRSGQYASISPLFAPDGRTIRFYLYLTVDDSAAQTRKAENARLFLLGSLVTFLATSIVIWIAFHLTVFRPLGRVLAVFRQVEGGNLTAQIEHADSRDELGELAQAFNSMLGMVEERDLSLRDSEQRYRSLIQKVQTAVVLHDRRGRIVTCNPLARELLGLPSGREPAEALINPAWAFVGEDGRVMPVDEYPTGRVLATGQPLRHHVVGISRPEPDGIAWALVNAEPEHDDAGQVVQVIVSFVDITRLKSAEAEIRTLNQELELRVVERTAQLQAANMELESFSYSVSHDLRAPLRHIAGFVALLQEEAGAALDDQSRHFLQAIDSSAKRMGALINDLLSFSRMGREEMSRSPVALADLVEEVINEAAPESEGRVIRWQIGTLPVVIGDRAMLRVAMTNLISNALKFTRRQPVAQIEIGCQAGEDAQTVVFVRDNGVGFDPRLGEQLFGVFHRLHRQEEFEGTGIGLANVRRVVERHGGRTWAEAVPGHGATFSFSLPAVRAFADGATQKRDGGQAVQVIGTSRPGNPPSGA